MKRFFQVRKKGRVTSFFVHLYWELLQVEKHLVKSGRREHNLKKIIFIRSFYKHGFYT